MNMSEINELPAIIGVKEVAKILGVNKDTAYRIVKTDGFPKLPVNKPILVPKVKFLEWSNLIN